MNFAFVQSSRRGGTDLLLTGFALKQIDAGKRVVGVVQTNTERPQDHRCDMDVQVLPTGSTIRISQDLGAQSRGCRLDPSALEQAVAQLEPLVEAGADLLVVNKFGKHEADGRGFRNLIARAVELDIPVIVGTNSLNKDAFQDFAAGTARELEPEPEQLDAWFDAVQSAAVA